MKNLGFIFAIISIVFFSCQKEVVEPLQTVNSIDEQVGILIPSTATLVSEKSAIKHKESEVLDAEDFAKLLAKSVNDKTIRKFIKDEANKQFDGDYDILVNKVIDSKVGAVSLREKIAQLNVKGNLKSAKVFDAALNNEKLNISVPVLIEEWDINKHELLVAVAVGAIDGETEYLNAYDSKGRVYLIDANVEPDVPVIVIANNERIGMDINSFDLKSTRISGYQEKVTYIKCPDLSAIESWYFGSPEIRFHAVVYTDNGGTTAILAANKTLTPSRDQAKSGYTLSQSLFRWYFDDNHGPDYYLQSSEIDDSGTSYKFTVGVSAGKKDVVTGTASFEITYKKQDKVLAGELIHYSTQSPITISDDNIEFKVENIY